MRANWVVRGAVDESVFRTVNRAVFGDVFWAVWQAVDMAVYRTAFRGRDTDLRGETPHPAFDDFLAAAGAETP